MANVLNTFKYLSNVSTRHILKGLIQPTTHISHVRSLYSPITLGVDTYMQQRARTDSQLGNITEKFRTKMEEYTTDDSKNMIFTEDLKNMIHLANESDINLIIKMMNKFNEQNKQLRFGNFVFGPVVMRMFHHLNKPNEALECFNSPKLEGFFDQLMSYQLLMDLLYENQMFKEMLQTFEVILGKQIEAIRYPRNIVVLAMAACYKLNTEDSYKYAINLWNDLKTAGHFPMRRATTYCAALALNQKAPEVCLEIVATTKNQNYTTVRNLRAAALTRIGRLDDAIQLLKSVLEQESPVKQTFNIDVVDEVRKAVEESGNADLQQQMSRIEKYFNEQGHLSNGTLDEQLCEEIKAPPFITAMKDQRQGNFRYNNNNRNDNYNSNNFKNNNFNKYQDQRGGPGQNRRQFREFREQRPGRPGLDDMN